MKKFAAILLALVLVFALCAPAMADAPEHTYTAYQIFTGTQRAGHKEISVTDWGDGVNGAVLLAALKADETLGEAFDACEDAKDVAAVMSKWADSSPEAKAFARIVYDNKTSGNPVVSGETVLNAGYYLIVDSTTEGSDYYNLALLALSEKENPVVITSKTAVPTVEKKVKDANDSTGEVSDWQDSADHDFGDVIPFKLTANISSDTSIDEYAVYRLVFHDTGCAGLAVNEDSFHVYVDGTEVTNTSLFVVDINGNGNDFTVTIPDAKDCGAVDGSVVTVEYTATLTEQAQLGSAGNPNVVFLEYSNNPNWTPASPEDEENSPTGETAEDKVIVFTYGVEVDKVDEEGDALIGAGFTLYKWNESKSGDDKWEQVGEERSGIGMHEFVWNGIDDGNYKLVESTVPAGYIKMNDLEFTVSAEHELNSDNPALTALNGGNLESGTYLETGLLKSQVVNYEGSLLPETGGIGTHIFYIVGALLLVGASVLLITRKRMGDEA